MLVEFRVANFRSFKEEQTLSLVASKDEAHPGNVITKAGVRLLKAAAIYGANASGKSNLAKALRVMGSFVRHSATRMNLGDKIPGISPFRLAHETARQPSMFEVVIILDSIRYEYGFSADSERVHQEWLHAFPLPYRRRQRWLERGFDRASGDFAYAFRGPLEREMRILEDKTRDNGLILSRGAELNIKPLVAVFRWFRERLWQFDMSDDPLGLINRVAERVKGDPKLRDRVLQLIRHADLGIDRLAVTEVPFSLEGLHEGLRSFLEEEAARKATLSTGVRNGQVVGFAVTMGHRCSGVDSRVEFNLQEDESNGTQRFFALAGPFLDALEKGAVVVVDELECSMHPVLSRKLLELFQSPEANKTGAQLVFATHDSTLMDQELFRRDQIWLTERNSKGATELFSLYDVATEGRPRSTTAFQRNYLAGRYGGVPKPGRIFEDLEF